MRGCSARSAACPRAPRSRGFIVRAGCRSTPRRRPAGRLPRSSIRRDAPPSNSGAGSSLSQVVVVQLSSARASYEAGERPCSRAPSPEISCPPGGPSRTSSISDIDWAAGAEESLDAGACLCAQLDHLDEPTRLARGGDDVDSPVWSSSRQDGGRGDVEEIPARVDEQLKQVDDVVVVGEGVGETGEGLQESSSRVSSVIREPRSRRVSLMKLRRPSRMSCVMSIMDRRGGERVAVDHEASVVGREVELREHDPCRLMDETARVRVADVVAIACRPH